MKEVISANSQWNRKREISKSCEAVSAGIIEPLETVGTGVGFLAGAYAGAKISNRLLDNIWFSNNPLAIFAVGVGTALVCGIIGAAAGKKLGEAIGNTAQSTLEIGSAGRYCFDEPIESTGRYCFDEPIRSAGRYCFYKPGETGPLNDSISVEPDESD